MSKFFIRRPIVAIVIAILIVIVGTCGSAADFEFPDIAVSL